MGEDAMRTDEQKKRWYAYMDGWSKEHYDTLHIRIPKGRKRLIQTFLSGKGKSMSEYVGGLIKADMGLTDDEWIKREEK